MQALSMQLNLSQSAYLEFIDLVATAIASDIVPITGENRILSFYGLEKINTEPSMGLKALMHLANIKHKVHIHNLVFIVAPRINAAGRMNDAYDAVHLFIEKNYENALLLAQKLNENNTLRKTADASITEEALALIKADEQHAFKKTTVVYQEHWHKGVIGIVASRLIENYYRPTVVLTKSGEVVSGSARSVPGFNLYEAIDACRAHLIGYGGHFAAAGLTLLPEQVPLFINKFEEVVAAQIAEPLLTPEIVIDAEVELSYLSFSFFNIINQMEPFGPENHRPVFLARKVTVSSLTLLKEQHIRFTITQKGTSFPAIAFNMAHKEAVLKNSELIDIVFTLSINEWNGEKLLQLKVLDLKPSCIS
jgi:single-stranded-DNA-specific exonuclease